MTFEQLRYFIETYRQHSFTKAANNLYISRQSLSATIQKLEQEMHVALFTRHPNKIEPTEAGKEFYQSALIIINEQISLQKKMQAHSHIYANTSAIRVAIGDTLANIYGDELIDVLTTAFPFHRFTFSNIGYSFDNIPYDNFDLTIISIDKTFSSSFSTQTGYALYTIQDIPSYVWISADSPLAKYPILNYNLLENYTQLIYKEIFNPITASHAGQKIKTLKLKQPFINLIETAENQCYTTDMPIHHGNFLFKDFFLNRNVILKQLNVTSALQIIYNKNLHFDFLSPIYSVLTTVKK